MFKLLIMKCSQTLFCFLPRLYALRYTSEPVPLTVTTPPGFALYLIITTDMTNKLFGAFLVSRRLWPILNSLMSGTENP
jgi:hypothetical protein